MAASRDTVRKQRVLMGTCGWSDHTLLRCGRFYPASVRSAEDRLRHYGTHFPCVEVDTSTYAIPSKASVRRWVQSVPPGFVFHFKAFGLFCSKSCPFTAIPGDIRCKLSSVGGDDQIKLSSLSKGIQDEVWAAFNGVLEPVFAAGALGVVLFQFHLSFKPSEENRAHVLWCRRNLDSRFDMAVEFRNRDWFAGDRFPSTCEWLKENGLAFVAADELAHETFQRDREQTGLPEGQEKTLLPVAWAVTQPSFHYIRVHRREGSKRVLSDSELQTWVARLHSKVLENLQGPIYFMWGTDWEDQPIVNARNLTQLLPPHTTFDWRAAQLAAPPKGSLLSLFKTVPPRPPPGPPADGPAGAFPGQNAAQNILPQIDDVAQFGYPTENSGSTRKRIVEPVGKAVAGAPPAKHAKATPPPKNKKASAGAAAASGTITSFFKRASGGT